MSDLPEDRLGAEGPFTYCGVDCFGPWYIKDGRKIVKRYGVLFTCLSSRAIHVETVNSMTTDSFINALRRLIAIRGPVRQIRCDQGTNFVGADRELCKAMAELKDDQIHNFLLKQNCDFIKFKLNVPNASHMGGVWERQIRTVRSVLNGVLKNSGEQLDDESLRTLMYEVTAIVNSRPLTVDNLNDPTSLEPLTPNHLLMMKSKIILPPPGNFQREDLYSRKRWRRVQHLVNEFWKRWRLEYLQNLQPRQKWTKHYRDFETGDVVMMKDDSAPRYAWKLARVVETTRDEDNHVRKVKLVFADGSNLDRPIHKLVLLVENVDW
jgi:hypothetical protein